MRAQSMSNRSLIATVGTSRFFVCQHDESTTEKMRACVALADQK